MILIIIYILKYASILNYLLSNLILSFIKFHNINVFIPTIKILNL